MMFLINLVLVPQTELQAQLAFNFIYAYQLLLTNQYIYHYLIKICHSTVFEPGLLDEFPFANKNIEINCGLQHRKYLKWKQINSIITAHFTDALDKTGISRPFSHSLDIFSS